MTQQDQIDFTLRIDAGKSTDWHFHRQGRLLPIIGGHLGLLALDPGDLGPAR